MNAASFSRQGRGRATNEDGVLVLGRSRVYLVVDGVGDSHGAAADVIAAFRAVVGERSPSDPASARTLLREALTRANDDLVARGQRDGGSCCAATAAVAVADGRAVVAWCGDCRVHLLSGGRARLLTRDHTRLSDLEERGLVGSGDLPASLRKSALTKCLGRGDEPGIEFAADVTLVGGDVLLLCTDGLSDVFPLDEMGRVLRTAATAGDAVSVLTEVAADRSEDDASAVVVVVSARDGSEVRDPRALDEGLDAVATEVVGRSAEAGLVETRPTAGQFVRSVLGSKRLALREAAILGGLVVAALLVPTLLQLLGRRLEGVGLEWWLLGGVALYAVLLKLRTR